MIGCLHQPFSTIGGPQSAIYRDVAAEIAAIEESRRLTCSFTAAVLSGKRDLRSRTSSRDPVQPLGSVIASSSCVRERLVLVSDLRGNRAQRPAVTPECTAGVAAEVLAGPVVTVQLFANDLHSCEIRRKCVE
ncbi:hypothetical protein PAMA_012118 [Pampus argenteus]